MLIVLLALVLQAPDKLGDPAPPVTDKLGDPFVRRVMPEVLRAPAAWPSLPVAPAPTDWPARRLPPALKAALECPGNGCECSGDGACGGSGCKCRVARLPDLPANVFAPERVRIRRAALVTLEDPPKAAPEPNLMPAPAGIRKPAAHAVACPCCGEVCACVVAGDCGHAGCACGHAMKSPPAKVYPSAQAVQTATPPVAQAAPVTYAAPTYYQWSTPIYQATPYTTFYPQVYGGYSQPLYGANCANGACYVPARGGLFGGWFR